MPSEKLLFVLFLHVLFLYWHKIKIHKCNIPITIQYEVNRPIRRLEQVSSLTFEDIDTLKATA